MEYNWNSSIKMAKLSQYYQQIRYNKYSFSISINSQISIQPIIMLLLFQLIKIIMIMGMGMGMLMIIWILLNKMMIINTVHEHNNFLIFFIIEH